MNEAKEARRATTARRARKEKLGKETPRLVCMEFVRSGVSTEQTVMGSTLVITKQKKMLVLHTIIILSRDSKQHMN